MREHLVALWAALALSILALLCVAFNWPTTGADWPKWMVGSLIAYFVACLLERRAA